MSFLKRAMLLLAEDYDDRFAGLLLCQADGKFLLVRRSEHENRAGQWEQPGGHVREEDANDLAAAVREAIEELGGLPKKVSVLYEGVRQIPNGKGVYTTVVAVTEPGDWEPKLSDGHDAWGWFDIKSFPEATHPGVYETINNLLEEKKAA